MIMKIEIRSKKGLKTSLSILVDKQTIKKKLEERLDQLQKEVSLKGFRPGKVPTSVIKSQYGKAVYGEVVDKILRESSLKALEEKKIRAAGQPKIDLKTFGEGKDLSYFLEVESLPIIKLKSFDSLKALNYIIKVDKKNIDNKIEEIADNYKNFTEKQSGEKAKLKDQITFDYKATVDGKSFEGSEGKGVQIELGKDLFLKGFDEQLINVVKNEEKIVIVNLPDNHPKKELAKKETKFKCKIINIKKPEKTKIDDTFAKNMGAKDLSDLKILVEKQISSEYKQALDGFTKKTILDQLEKNHEVELPQNLVDVDLASITKNLKKEEIEKHKNNNEKLAKSRVKLGLILNEIGEKNNLKVTQEELKAEINKQIKGMPGQEKMVMEYYQKNTNAAQSLQGAIYEEKIISLLKSKMKLINKTISTEEAMSIISKLNEPKIKKTKSKTDKLPKTNVSKTKK